MYDMIMKYDWLIMVLYKEIDHCQLTKVGYGHG